MSLSKVHLSLVLILSLSGCASLSQQGEKVHVEVVQKSEISIRDAQKKLESNGCVYVKSIEAKIAPGSTSVSSRLLIGLKNKTADEGGNAVISSLESYAGLPIYTKGMVYRCPEGSVTTDGV